MKMLQCEKNEKAYNNGIYFLSAVLVPA